MAGSYRENWHLTGPEDRPVENDSNGLGRDSAAKMNFLAMGCRIGRGGVRDERGGRYIWEVIGAVPRAPLKIGRLFTKAGKKRLTRRSRGRGRKQTFV